MGAMKIPILILCGLALAACGAEEEPAADGEQEARDAMLAYTKCMREHGVDIPDPKPGARGLSITPPKGTPPSTMDAADEACRKHLEAIKPPEMSEEEKREFREAALAHARCMREHGIDIPDPTFGENGEARIQIRRKGSGSGPAIDPEDPEFRAAEEACRDKMPSGPGASTERNAE